MLANFFNSQEFRDSYDILFIYRWSPQYEKGFKNRVPLQIENIPVRLYEINDVYVSIDSISLIILRRPLNFLINLGLVKYFFLFINTIILFRIIRKKKVTILHVNNGGYPGAQSTISMVIAARLCGITCIVYVVNNIAVGYNSLDRRFDYVFDQIVVCWVKMFVTGSLYAGNALKKILKLPSNKIQCIPNGIASRKVTETREQVIQRLHLPNNRLILSVIANLEERKGHIFLLKSLKQLKDMYPGISIPVCVIEGTGSTDKILKTFVDKNDLKTDVLFIPHEEQIFNLISASDCIILPSIKDEDFPNVILESMSLGKAIIASNFSGIPEQIEHMKSGYLVEPGDVSDLAMAIKFMLDHPEMKNLFGENAKVRFEELFKDKIAINHYRKIYNKLTEEISS
ncbi:MAG: hypothetical protein CVV30_02965 [Methanomicrobiales archaeon HGW-Methanomicrobiales-1]|jgi:glycosyltransferase involved in cell wall biosynthesis|nr:MAG: hypothetical protein CVV30_02965 [Methanomicrobiales archaeon HGW-Methanomicrobiales-1]